MTTRFRGSFDNDSSRVVDLPVTVHVVLLDSFSLTETCGIQWHDGFRLVSKSSEVRLTVLLEAIDVRGL